MMRRAICLMMLALLVAACASTPQPLTRSYLLTAPNTAGPVVSSIGPATLTVGAISLPAYLQSKDIVVATGASELRGARNHQWAEPLAAGIGRYLALALGEPVSAAPLLELSVAHFHGSERGAVVLEADWQLRERGAAAPFAQGRFDATIMQDGPGFEAMIEAQRALLDQLLTAAGAAAGGRANQKQPAPTNDAAAMSENASS